jgi:hypothetical protein
MTLPGLLRIVPLLAVGAFLLPEAAHAQAYGITPQVQIDEFSAPVSIVEGNFDTSGRPGLAMCFRNERIILKRHVDAGRFVVELDVPIWQAHEPVPPRTFYLFHSHCRYIAAADFNEDGIDDVVVVHSNGFTALLSSADGSWARFEYEPFPAENFIATAAVADIDGDGHLDLVMVRAQGLVELWPGTGKGSFQEPRPILQTGEPFLRVVKAADMDRDGRQDLILGSKHTDNSWISVAWNRGNGDFERREVMRIDGLAMRDIAVGDLNGDGYPDIALTLWENVVGVLHQRADGEFDYPIGYWTIKGSSDVRTVDMDGDGRLDLVIAHHGWGSVTTLRQESGALVFNAWVRWMENVSEADQALAIADFDGDGCKDIVVAVIGGYRFLRGLGCAQPSNAWLSSSERNVRGSWYDPDKAGQGFIVDVVPNGQGAKSLFVGWYTFGTGTPTAPQWFVAQGPSVLYRDPDTGLIRQTLDLFVARGGSGRFAAPPIVEVDRVGSLSFEMYDSTLMRIDYRFDAPDPRWAHVESGSALVERVPTIGDGNAAQALRGSWYDPATSGQGLQLDPIAPHEGSPVLFGAWFTYHRTSGERMWLVLQGPLDPHSDEQRVVLWYAAGGGLNTLPPVQATRVGIATLARQADGTLRMEARFDLPNDPRWADVVVRLQRHDPD